MRLVPLDPVGVEITDVDLSERPPAVAELRRVLADHGVAVLRGQRLDDDAFVAWLRGLGELVFTEGETPVPGHPELNVVSNVGRAVPPRSVFHVDTSYVRRPPAYTSLRAVTVPEQGGQTVFTNQYAAYETLPHDLRERCAGRSIRHVVSGVSPGRTQESEAWHPIVRRHPISGRVSLYLSTPERCVEVSGLPHEEGRDLVERLYRHSTADQHARTHTWAAGDVVIWDNGCVLHKADHSGVVGDRVMHRGMVDAPAPMP